jgi:hypothetical protein
MTEQMKEQANTGLILGAVNCDQLIAELAVLKVLDELVPTCRITTMQSTMIKASITAYSTAVGPSSLVMKFQICLVIVFMAPFPICGIYI